MRFFLLVLIFLSGCSSDARSVSPQPIFTDDERLDRAVQFDEWYSKAVRGL